MGEKYEKTLADLRREIETEGARPSVIDALLVDLLADSGEHLTADLLSLLSDSADDDLGMFSLIHTAECADDKTYIREFLSAFPHLMSSAPRWASIVLMRVLNNDSSRAELVYQLRTATTSAKDAVRETCRGINEVRPQQFLSKTVAVMEAAS